MNKKGWCWWWSSWHRPGYPYGWRRRRGGGYGGGAGGGVWDHPWISFWTSERGPIPTWPLLEHLNYCIEKDEKWECRQFTGNHGNKQANKQTNSKQQQKKQTNKKTKQQQKQAKNNNTNKQQTNNTTQRHKQTKTTQLISVDSCAWVACMEKWKMIGKGWEQKGRAWSGWGKGTGRGSGKRIMTCCFDNGDGKGKRRRRMVVGRRLRDESN